MTDPTAPDAPVPTDPAAPTPAEPEAAEAADEPDAWRGFGRPAEGQPDTAATAEAQAAE